MDSGRSEGEQPAEAFLAQRGIIWTTISAWNCRLTAPELRRLANPEEQVLLAYEAGFRAFPCRSKLLKLLVVVGLPVLGGTIAAVAAGMNGVSNFIGILAFMLLGEFVVFVGMFALLAGPHRRAVRAVLADHGYPICRQCGHDRTGLQAALACPQCGAAPADADVEQAHSDRARVWHERLPGEPTLNLPDRRQWRIYIALWVLLLVAITWMSYVAPPNPGLVWYAAVLPMILLSALLGLKGWPFRW